MDTPDTWQPTLDPALVEMLDGSDLGSKISTGFEAAAVAYAFAMIGAQTLEFAVKLVTPAFDAPTDDDDAATVVVRAALDRFLGEAIKDVRQHPAAAQLDGHAQLVVDLDVARGRRNELAHDFWISRLSAVFGGRGDEVATELAAWSDEFARLTRAVVALLEGPLLARGHTRESLDTLFTMLMGAATLAPDVFDGVDLVRDPDVIERLSAFVNELESGQRQIDPQ